MNLFKLILLSTLLFSFNSLAITIKTCDTNDCVSYFKSFKKAAQRGHPKAAFMLGKFYQNGYGTPINIKKSITYYRKAALFGITEAKFKTGYLLLTNKESYNYKEGIKWLTNAANFEHSNAAFILGDTYFNEKNFSDADKWLAIAYEKHQVDMPRWIHHTKEKEQYDETALPLLASAIADEPMVIDEGKIASYQKIERITISSPSMQNVFDGMLDGFKSKIKSTGTRLPIRCVDNVACQDKSLNEMKDSIWVEH